MKTLKFELALCGVAAALWVSPLVTDTPRAQPGAEAVTCQQIGMESRPTRGR